MHERPFPTFRPLVIATRANVARSTLQPQRPAVRPRSLRTVRPVGLGNDRLYWFTRPPAQPRGWTGRRYF